MGIIDFPVEEIAVDTYGSDTSKGYTACDLDSGHEHYKAIMADFQKAGIRVLNIERLHNLSLTEAYLGQRKMMMKYRGSKTINPDYKLNEKYLYHGTAAIREHVCEQGLDDKLSGKGCFGNGIYFSDSIKKCLKYANKREGDEGMILCSRVILGESKVFEEGMKDPSLMKEPEKGGSFKGFRFYCSVKGRPGQFNEFVVYRKGQTLIEYLITYSKNSPPETNVKEPGTEPIKPVNSSPASPKHIKPVNSSSSVSSESSEGSYEEEDSNQSLYDSDSDTSDAIFEDAQSDFLSEEVPEEPEEEIDTVKKREKFVEETGEKNDNIIDSYLEATNHHLDVAVYLYRNRDQIEEEMEKLRTSLEAEGVQTTDENGKEITFHPEGIPRYKSKAWNQHSQSERESYIQMFLSIFMNAIALEEEHSAFAKEILKNNKYDIDQTIIAFYNSL